MCVQSDIRIFFQPEKVHENIINITEAVVMGFY